MGPAAVVIDLDILDDRVLGLVPRAEGARSYISPLSEAKNDSTTTLSWRDLVRPTVSLTSCDAAHEVSLCDESSHSRSTSRRVPSRVPSRPRHPRHA